MISTTDGFIELTLKFRLWASVPEAERVTEADILRHFPEDKYAEFARQRLRDRLNNPECKCATRQVELWGKWLPCGYPTGGYDRCKRHGGPSIQPSPAPSLRLQLVDARAEIERLRAELGRTAGEEPTT